MMLQKDGNLNEIVAGTNESIKENTNIVSNDTADESDTSANKFGKKDKIIFDTSIVVNEVNILKNDNPTAATVTNDQERNRNDHISEMVL